MSKLIEMNCKFSEELELHPDNPKDLNWNYIKYSCDNLLKEEFLELQEAIYKCDKPEVLDGAFDVAVVALNIAYKLFRLTGDMPVDACYKVEEGFRRVLESNLSKLPVTFSEDGKVKKGDNFFKPNFEDLI